MKQEACSYNSLQMIVFGSGEGTNFKALHGAFKRAHNETCVELFVTDKPLCNAAKWAQEHNIPVVAFAVSDAKERQKLETHLLEGIKGFFEKTANMRLVQEQDACRIFVLAGFMRILSNRFLNELQELWPNAHMINLHPAHLADYKGPRAYEYAVQHKFPSWGLTVHKVTEVVDEGELVESADIFVFPYESPSDLQLRCKPTEHEVLARAVRKILKEHFST
jgi:phosphoribosylglycinamide formyltransferase 1